MLDKNLSTTRTKVLTSLFFSLCVFSFILVFTGCDRSAELTVETEPGGADVYIDGKLAGTTPLYVDISPATKKIRVEFEDISATSEPKLVPKKISKTLTAAYLPLTANLPLFVALEKGYFERNGIKVNAIEATSPNDIITAIVAGKVDFAAVLAYSLLFPAANRYPGAFKFYSSSEETCQWFTSSIIVRKNSPINSYEDLRGKKIGVYTGLVQVNFLKAILAGMGIAESEVEIVEISPRLQIQGLVSGEYDALSSTEPTVNIAKLKGIAKVVAESPRVKFIMCPFPSTAATVSTKLLNEDPEAVEAVITALEMAVDFINNNREEAKKFLPKYTPIPKDIANEVLADLKLFKYCKLGEENRLNVQRFADYLYENGILKKRIEDVNPLFGDYQEVCAK